MHRTTLSRRSEDGRVSRAIAATLVAVSLVLATLAATGVAHADTTTCGPSGSHTLCITVSDTTLTGDARITVTNSPNDGLVFFHWTGAAGKAYSNLMEDFTPSAVTGDYSFTWPTARYPSGSGELQARAASTSADPVSVPVTLSNPQFVPQTDWASFVPPNPWAGSSDPHVLAVGDGPSDEVASNAVASYISSLTPPLVLFLGDIYEHPSYTTAFNHYGVSSMDVPGAGTLWGAFADVTQPAFGNHEVQVTGQWRNEWHGRPLWTSFTFGNVLFLDLDSNAPMNAGSPQFQFVQDTLADPSVPPCIVSYWHIPTLQGAQVNTAQAELWQYLADHGGDLVLNGHVHHMNQFVPLNDLVQRATATEPQMVELISGAGGHVVGPTRTAPLLAWSLGKTPGVLDLPLDGAANSGTPTSLSWQFQDTLGNVLHTGSISCTPPV